MDTSPLKYKKWRISDVPDQDGKIVVVTGANSGLGYMATRVLASQGATVIMAVRSSERGEHAKQMILEEDPNANLDVMQLDLSSLNNIRKFATEFSKKYDSLDVLLNNAGIMQPPYSTTEDGFELQFGVNHLGHFALTGLLLDVLLKTPGARVITQSSIAHLSGKINFDDINSVNRYSKTGAYAQSKIANLYFAYELHRRASAAGKNLMSIAVHPGYTNTELQQKGPKMGGKSIFYYFYAVSDRIIAQDVKMGVLPMLYAATMDDVNSGDYIGPKRLFGTRGFPRRIRSNRRSYDPDIAQRLWEISEEMTGVHYDALQ